MKSDRRAIKELLEGLQHSDMECIMQKSLFQDLTSTNFICHWIKDDDREHGEFTSTY